MRTGHSLVAFMVLFVLGSSVLAEDSPESSRSPVNQVFQFMQSGTCTAWKDGSKNVSTAYLWIPEDCQRVRALLVLCTNVPEHMLAGNDSIRKTCAANSLAIVWCCPSFMNFRKDKEKNINNAVDYSTSVAFLQQLLDGFASTSGYAEIATVPWLPIGESGHLLMVDALVEQSPERCIAGVWLKNNHLPPHDRKTPALVVFGTSQEWSQDKSDIRTKWNDIGKAYDSIVNERKKNPDWPLSYTMDGNTGHFDCSEPTVSLLAAYIDEVCHARLSQDGSPALKPVSIIDGYLADLPVPGHENHPVAKYSAAPEGLRSSPWFFSSATAEKAQGIASINWTAKTQFLGFVDASGNMLPYDFNGIQNLKSVKWEADHVTFTAKAKVLDEIPAGFIGAGDKLLTTPGEPSVEWLCGPIAPLGNGRFRIALDRTYGSAACYLAARQAGTSEVRSVVEPLGVSISSLKNTTGAEQKITFEPIADIASGAETVPLVAKSNSGLPVEFYVVAGPAVVEGNTLKLTKIPPKAKLPLTITVAAWQWGRADEPKIKTAAVVTQTFNILPKP